MACRKYNLNELRKLREIWIDEDIITEAQNEEDRNTYFRRKKAIDMYIDGFKLKHIQDETQVTRADIMRFLKRMTTVQNGKMLGYVALLPYRRINAYARKRDIEEAASVAGEYAGAFSELIDMFQDKGIVDFIMDTYYGIGKCKETREINISLKNLHKLFLAKLIEFGLSETDYPLNTADKGYRSLCRFVKMYKQNNYRYSPNRFGKSSAQIASSTGYGEVFRADVIAPYSVIQVDGHKLDVLYVVEYKDEHGEIVYDCALRPWIFVLIDVATRAILGYYLSMYENYNGTDVLKAFQHALLPKERLEFSFKHLTYPENGGFPDTAYKELQYAVYDTIMMDNAKCHLAKDTISKLTETLKCNVNFGSVATPETRGIVERFFAKFESYGFHRLPGSVGSNPQDPRFAKARKEAIEYNITYDVIKEIAEWCICQINNTPSIANKNLTPIHAMGYKLESGEVPNIANSEMIAQVRKLHYIRKTYTIQGSEKMGRRPYITYLSATYRSNIISMSYKYLGQEVILLINPDNLATIDVHNADTGEFIDTVQASGAWGRTPHSLRTRKEVLSWARRNKERYRSNDTDDPLAGFQKELEERARVNRRDRTKAAIIAQEQKTENARAKQKETKKRTEPASSGEKTDEDFPKQSGHENTREESLTTEEIRQLMVELGPEEFYEEYGYYL